MSKQLDKNSQQFYQSIKIPKKVRIKKFQRIAGCAVAICGLFWLYQYSEGQLKTYWWYILLPASAILTIGLLEFSKTHNRKLTEKGEAEQKRLRLEAEAKELELMQKWYVRYPFAAILLTSALYIVNKAPDMWWLAAGTVLYVVFLAFDAVLIASTLFAVYSLFQGVSALPISAVVIIGAFIMALSLNRNRR
ncbi:MAG: hypothetical protein KDJ99_11280 [Candidatus Competibacteraceae bacterium]|nr:hypothetical protein [Candidatus Competibacteraceae bacterium]